MFNPNPNPPPAEYARWIGAELIDYLPNLLSLGREIQVPTHIVEVFLVIAWNSLLWSLSIADTLASRGTTILETQKSLQFWSKLRSLGCFNGFRSNARTNRKHRGGKEKTYQR